MDLLHLLKSISPFLKMAGVKIEPDSVRLTPLPDAAARVDAATTLVTDCVVSSGGALLYAVVNGKPVRVLVVESPA